MSESVARVYLSEGVSSRTGKKFYMLCVEFSNGYTFKSFLNDEQVFAIKSSGLEIQN